MEWLDGIFDSYNSKYTAPDLYISNFVIDTKFQLLFLFLFRGVGFHRVLIVLHRRYILLSHKRLCMCKCLTY